METLFGIPWLITMAVVYFCNEVLTMNIDQLRERNHGLEVHPLERLESNCYGKVIMIFYVLGVIFSSSWSASFASLLIGHLATMLYSKYIGTEMIDAYIIFGGKFIKPVLILFSLIALFFN